MQPPSRHQFERFKDQLAPMLRRLGRARARLERRGATPGDAYYANLCQAYDALHNLFIATHYASCAPGTVGKPAVSELTSEDAESPPPSTPQHHRVASRNGCNSLPLADCDQRRMRLNDPLVETTDVE